MAKNKTSKPKYVHVYRDRHGKVRIYFNKPGQPRVPLPGPLNSPAFFAAYAKAIAGVELTTTTKPKAAKDTISALIELYYNSPLFHGLSDSSKTNYRRILERFRQEHGDKPITGLGRKHVTSILGKMSDRPEAANTLLKRLKVLMGFALDNGMIDHNPLVGMKGFKTSSEGFHTWSEDEIARFEDRHPIGSKARLAMTLMLCTGQRRSDVVRMGWQHVDGNLIAVKQQKTGANLLIPIHPKLKAVLDQMPRDNMTFLLTDYGKPFSANGFGNWMRKRCDEAALSVCSSHGLRKACARRLAEAGCSNQEIEAVTEHETEAEVTRYTKAADQKVLALKAMGKLSGGEDGTQSANLSDKVSKSSS
ncbi:Site-specific recombinase XerD [Marinovum algicola DG 898]|nr:Site-specific recombinase XerD [Marinovum algicola DG 898]